MSNTSDMKDVFIGIPKDTGIVVDESKAKISVLDAAKIPYVNATENLDEEIFNVKITPTNDTLYAVRDAYRERIDVQGCRTDLFWRVTGIATAGISPLVPEDITYTLTCTKLSPTYPKVVAGGSDDIVGLNTSNVLKWDGFSNFTDFVLTEQGDTLISAGSSLDSFLEPDNFHGIKMYDEPYARDVFDTFRSIGVGTIGVGAAATTNFMTILAPSSTMDIEVGYLMTSQPSGFFASGTVSVTGVGTTTADLSSFPFTGVTTTTSVVPLITLSELPVGIISAPGPTGEFTEMLFTQDPTTISDNYAVNQSDSPYVNQTIEIMNLSRCGAGVSIRYDNSGISSGTREWNKFLDGFPNPDDLDGPDITEPPLGADKIYYPIGFLSAPVTGGSLASEGATLTITGDIIVGTAGYQTISTSCNDTALNAALAARNTAESALAVDTDLTGMINTSNLVKQKISDEFNLRIWAYRMQIGESIKRLSSYVDWENLMENSPYANIMNRE